MKKRRIFLLLFGFLIVGGAGVVLWANREAGKVQAAWFDDNWGYRVAVPVSAHTSAESNVYWTPPNIDTSDTNKFSSTCGNVRWTDASGKLLKYYVSSGCGGASTVFNVYLDSFPAGAQTFYYYYGNTGGPDGRTLSSFATAATGVTNGTAGSEEKGSGPVGFWRFDDGTGTTAQDSSSTNADGTTSGATWQTEDLCFSGKCLLFDGTDDYAVTGNLAMIIANGSTTTNVSWGGWFKPATAVASKTLLHKTNEFRLTTDANSKPVCEIYSGSWQTGATGQTALPLSSWSHVLCTYDGSFIRTYVNGVQVAYQAETDNLTGTANAFNIARDSASSYYQGQIDEVKLWNYPLTAYQARTEYNQAGAVRFGPSSGAP